MAPASYLGARAVRGDASYFHQLAEHGTRAVRGYAMSAVILEGSPATYLTTGPGPGAVRGDASWSFQLADHHG